jgi:hypothetical protein
MPDIVSKVTKDKKRRGFILLTHTLMFGFTLAFVGLAVDAGTMYVIKGRLSSAVDAAALAAGRSLNLADTVSGATAAATTTATQFFNANFPNGFLGTGTVTLATPTFTQQLDGNGLPNGILSIAVNASVPAPTYFMRILGVFPGMSVINSVTVSASGTASRRSTVMILVLDTSISMQAGSPSACSTMVSAAQSFITNFSPFDTIGAIGFNVTSSVIFPPSSAFGNGNLNTVLGNITCNSSTNTTSALWLAYEQIKSVGLPLAYNTIVLFTDGVPNGVNANFPLRTQQDNRYGPDYTQLSPVPTASADSCKTALNSDLPVHTPCIPMAAICTGATTQTITGTIEQGSNQSNVGATFGLFLPTQTSPAPSYPSTCTTPITPAALAAQTTLTGPSSDTPPQWSGPTEIMRQLIAYIPDFDLYGNSTHGVPTTSTPPASVCTGTNTGPACTVRTVTLQSTKATLTYDSRDFWEFQVNNLCTGASGNAVTPCANTLPVANQQYGGGTWASFPSGTPEASGGGTGSAGGGMGSNFFTSGPYTGFMRPDQPNTIVAAGMNTAMAEAYWIRQDASGCPGPGSLGTNGTVCSTLYHPTINTIYLTGNAGDQVDHEFLPIIANAQTIPALPYDSSFSPYTNPAYQSNQQQGLYQVTADKTQLTALFQALASEVLRLSQ